MLDLEGSFLIWLQSQKHLIPFCKLTFRVTLIYLLLHAICAMTKFSLRVQRISSQTVSVWSTAWTFEVLDKYERTEGDFCPYTASKGVMRVVVWYVVLYHHSARGNPLVLFFRGKAPQICFQTLVDNIRLTIRLGMIS
jgi:hypothetical protein